MSDVVVSVELDLKPGQLSRLEIKAPRYVADGEWVCAVKLDPDLRGSKFVNVSGYDAFQALCLAIRFIRSTLENWRDHRGDRYDTKEIDRLLETHFGK